MQLGLIDLFTILLVTVGPLKATIIFGAVTTGADAEFRRRTAIKASAVATGVLLLFTLFGEVLLQIFHVSLPALQIAGGLILVLFALGLVMGSDEGGHGAEGGEGGGNPSADVAIYPLAMPAIATPQGIVAVVTLAAGQSAGQLLVLVAVLLVVMAINLVCLLGANRILNLLGESGLKIIARVAGILLLALAVQLMILALRDLGALPVLNGGH